MTSCPSLPTISSSQETTTAYRHPFSSILTPFVLKNCDHTTERFSESGNIHTHTHDDLMNVLIIGTGEYSTGFNKTTSSDKSKGVLLLTCLDLAYRGLVDKIHLVGTSGKNRAALMHHIVENVANEYNTLQPLIEERVFLHPPEGIDYDPQYYKTVIDTRLRTGDGVIICTPDRSHYEIATFAIQRGAHVYLVKPAVQRLQQHFHLQSLCRQHGCVVQIDYHKRFDPIYSNARRRIRSLGRLSHFFSYMSQPREQVLDVFHKWASGNPASLKTTLGVREDVSYFLNSHHMDFLAWTLEGKSRPLTVTAYAARGILDGEFSHRRDPAAMTEKEETQSIEDTITVVCQWENNGLDANHVPSIGTSVFVSSWVGPNTGEVHTQQRFSCLCEEGEIRVDQAHRGYEVTVRGDKYRSLNPLYMDYSGEEKLDVSGAVTITEFVGQLGYGYRPIETWVRCCTQANATLLPSPLHNPENSCEDEEREAVLECYKAHQRYSPPIALDINSICDLEKNLLVTGMLDAAKRSLDAGGALINVQDLIEAEKSVFEQRMRNCMGAKDSGVRTENEASNALDADQEDVTDSYPGNGCEVECNTKDDPISRRVSKKRKVDHVEK